MGRMTALPTPTFFANGCGKGDLAWLPTQSCGVDGHWVARIASSAASSKPTNETRLIDCVCGQVGVLRARAGSRAMQVDSVVDGVEVM